MRWRFNYILCNHLLCNWKLVDWDVKNQIKQIIMEFPYACLPSYATTCSDTNVLESFRFFKSENTG